jgi:hypothetical protein
VRSSRRRSRVVRRGRLREDGPPDRFNREDARHLRSRAAHPCALELYAMAQAKIPFLARYSQGRARPHETSVRRPLKYPSILQFPERVAACSPVESPELLRLLRRERQPRLLLVFALNPIQQRLQLRWCRNHGPSPNAYKSTISGIEMRSTSTIQIARLGASELCSTMMVSLCR